MKAFTFIILVCLLLACAKKGDSASASAIQGTDMSGTYMITGVQCYNSSLTTMTHATTFSGVYTDTVTITGNSYSESSTAGSCSITATGNITFTTDGMTLTSSKITSATGGSCTYTQTLNGTSITPTTLSTGFATNDQIANKTNVSYIWLPSTKTLGLVSTYTDNGGGYCFLVYSKQ